MKRYNYGKKSCHFLDCLGTCHATITIQSSLNSPVYSKEFKKVISISCPIVDKVFIFHEPGFIFKSP